MNVIGYFNAVIGEYKSTSKIAIWRFAKLIIFKFSEKKKSIRKFSYFPPFSIFCPPYNQRIFYQQQKLFCLIVVVYFLCLYWGKTDKKNFLYRHHFYEYMCIELFYEGFFHYTRSLHVLKFLNFVTAIVYIHIHAQI